MPEAAVSTFADVAPLFLSSRRVSESHRRRVTKLASRAGKMTPQSLNSFLLRRMNEAAGYSVMTERSICLTLWRWAYDQGHYDLAPRGVLRMKAHRKPTKAWTLDQIRQILAACDQQGRRLMWSGVTASQFLRCWIMLSYETGARLGDVFAFSRCHLNGDAIAWTQSKTGDPLTRTLTPACLTLVNAMLAKSPDGTILGWVCSHRQATRRMRALLNAVGLDGSSKWLRRSGATHCEMARAGAGRLHLGHRSPALFESNYCDWSQLRTRTPTPPALVSDET